MSIKKIKQTNAAFRHQIILDDIRRYLRESKLEWKKLSGQTILLSGANGFLTSYMADTAAILNDEILDEPCRFIALTRRSVQPSDRIGHLLGRKDFTFLAADVAKPYKIPQGVKYLIHGASPASPKFYLDKRIETMDTNVNGLRTMLDYSLKNEVGSILYVSSSTIYGDVDAAHIPTAEDYPGLVSPTSERSCYSEAKRYGEALAYQFCRTHGTPINMVRPFHNYGPGLRLDDGRAIADFMSDALAGRPITIRSAGTTRLNYLYVADAAEGFWSVLLSGEKGEAFNVASGGPEISLLELANKISEQFSPKSKVELAPGAQKAFQKGAVSRTCADISKIKASTGWQPHTSLEEGLKRAIVWISPLSTGLFFTMR